MPNLDRNNCVYTNGKPFSTDDYGGLSVNGTMERKRGHVGQICATKRLSMDKAHGVMLKNGVYGYLFCQLLDLADDEATVLRLRTIESKTIQVFRYKLNTQQQSMKGIPSVDLVH